MRYKLLVVGALLTLGCATAGPQHAATVALASTEAALGVLQDGELAMVCGVPTAPAPPACVTAAKHQVISQILVTAFDLEAKAARIVAALPPGQSPPETVGAILGQIQGAMASALAALPQGPRQASLAASVGSH